MSAYLSNAAIAAILGYLRDAIGFESFARDLSAHIDHLAAENARLREALGRIIKGAPTEEPEYEWTGNADDARDFGSELTHWSLAKIAREALSPAPSKKEASNV